MTVRFARRSDGDFRVDRDPEQLGPVRERHEPGAWTWLRQVHGAEVVVVDRPGAHAGAEADAAVTDVPDAVLAVHTADCVPVLLAAEADGVVGAAHAGWRGLADGILERTVAAMGRLGAAGITAHVGPHIRGRCYEFGPAELQQVVDRYGDAVRTETAWGTPGLDLAAGVRRALEPLGVTVVDHGGCTACEPTGCWSHRARADVGRSAATIVLRRHPEGAGSPGAPAGDGTGSPGVPDVLETGSPGVPDVVGTGSPGVPDVVGTGSPGVPDGVGR